MTMRNKKTGNALIAIAFISVIVLFFVLDPIAQDLNYHNFSDRSTLLSLPNALNVLSNLPFLFVGAVGLIALRQGGKNALTIVEPLKSSYFFLFLGAALVGFGSSYYHWNPNNETLVWDRIPMTIAFMGLYSIIIAEFISEKLGKALLAPLLIVGISSVLYWSYTESQGAGDLRFYAVVQFFPMLTIPVMLIFFKSKFDNVRGYWLLMLTYLGAKLFERFDHQIHSFLGLMSGHSIKHILPAIGLYILIKAYKNRSAA